MDSNPSSTENLTLVDDIQTPRNKHLGLGGLRKRGYGTISDKESVYYSSYVFDLTRSLSKPGGDIGYDPLAPPSSERRNLGWLGGVFAAVALAQFSTNLFLRVGK